MSAGDSPLDASALDVGRTFAECYRIDAVVGHGAVGTVYRALDERSREIVALKTIVKGLFGDDASRDRLHREVRLSRRIAHRNVARAFDVGEWRGIPYLTMEYVDGVSLRAMMRQAGRLSGADTLAIGRQIAEGLSAAHAAGVVHRDLKPTNILVDQAKRAVITDFGIASSLLGDDVAVATTLGPIGTPAYMAPEQLLARDVDERADLYALGLILYEMSTGRRPFARGAGDTLADARLDHDGPDPRAHAPVDDGLAELTMSLLRHSPDARPACARDVVLSIDRC